MLFYKVSQWNYFILKLYSDIQVILLWMEEIEKKLKLKKYSLYYVRYRNICHSKLDLLW